MKHLLALLLTATLAQADELYYLELEQGIARLEFAIKSDATNALPAVVAEIEQTNYIAQIHGHFHSANPDENKPCEVTPCQAGEQENIVMVETELTENQAKCKLVEYLTMVYTDDADADRKAEKLKKSKWLKDKVCKVTKTKRAKK